MAPMEQQVVKHRYKREPAEGAARECMVLLFIHSSSAAGNLSVLQR